MVSLFEFKVGDSKTEIETASHMASRLSNVAMVTTKAKTVWCCQLDITMNALEVMTVERRVHEDLQVTRTGLQPFSITPKFPGFQLLVSCLLTPKTDLGSVVTHSVTHLPTIDKLDSCSFIMKDFINQGFACQDSGSQGVFSGSGFRCRYYLEAQHERHCKM